MQCSTAQRMLRTGSTPAPNRRTSESVEAITPVRMERTAERSARAMETQIKLRTLSFCVGSVCKQMYLQERVS